MVIVFVTVGIRRVLEWPGSSISAVPLPGICERNKEAWQVMVKRSPFGRQSIKLHDAVHGIPLDSYGRDMS